jgi:hypothetical protein
LGAAAVFFLAGAVAAAAVERVVRAMLTCLWIGVCAQRRGGKIWFLALVSAMQLLGS